jgi:hypothetical protein
MWFGLKLPEIDVNKGISRSQMLTFDVPFAVRDLNDVKSLYARNLPCFNEALKLVVQ